MYFFKEYDAVKRLGIDEGKSYLKNRFAKDPSKSCMFLPTVCADKSWMHQIAATVEETISENEWTDIMVYMSSILIDNDIYVLPRGNAGLEITVKY